MSDIDVVVVSYNSADHLRGCVEPLAGIPGVHVVVVDNDSSDGSLAALAGMPVETIAAGANLGFAGACNRGWEFASSPYVLFLNPDARIDESSLRQLAAVLDARPEVGICAPRIVGDDGVLHHSLRRFPRLVSTYAQALYLHR